MTHATALVALHAAVVLFGFAHCLIDRDGRDIACNLPIGNGPLLEQAPAMAKRCRNNCWLRIIASDGVVGHAPTQSASHLTYREMGKVKMVDIGGTSPA